MIPEIERGALRRAFRLFPRTLPYLRPYRWSAGFAVALMVLITVLSLAEPWPLAFLVDTVLGKRQAPGWATAISGGGTRGLIVLAVSGGLLLTLVSGAVKVMSSYVTTKIDHSMSFDLRSDLLAHVQRLSLGFHDDANTGDLMFRINDQADAVGKVVIAVPDFVQGVLTLVGMLVIAFRIDPVLALLAMLVIPLVLRSTSRYANRVEPELQRVRDMESTNLAMVHEALATFRVIIAFGRERYESDRVRAHSEKTVDARIRLTVRQAFFKLAVGSITAAGTAAVIGLGAHRVLNGQITTGELLVMAAYIAAVYQPLETLTYSITVLQEQFVSLAHAIELLEFAPDVTERDGAIALERARGEITFESVGFSYATRKETLADVSFSIAPGDAVAIVGATGAGKSTLVSMMPRLYDVERGRITIDGLDVRDVTLASLRAQFGVVLQEPLLFSDTIAENIAYGRPGATRVEIEQAARNANAHEFISRLPKGYETSLGERGTKISGGERQRIAVARAFLRDAPILILDEPTSSIDSRTEAVILDALDRLMEGRTTIMIAHRLSTIRRADKILVIDGGRLVEVGTQDELLERDGAYASLWRAQTTRRVRTEAARAAIAKVDTAGTNGGGHALALETVSAQ